MNSQTIYLHFNDKADLRAEVQNGKITLVADGGALDFCVFLGRKEIAERLYQQLGNCLGVADHG